MQQVILARGADQHLRELCGVNRFNYLQALQGNARDVMATPAPCLPWNFHEQLACPA